MSAVNTETGELIDLDRAAAERRAERIRLRLDAIADNYAAVMPMIREAIEKRDDLALGYRSPGEYVADRFGGALQNLGIEVRREVVRELTEAGMSTRAIAPVVGISHETVRSDHRAGVKDLTPATPIATPDVEGGGTSERPSAEAPMVVHPEGEEAREFASQAPEASKPVERPRNEPSVDAPRPPVVGIDGKRYSRPEEPTPTPTAPRRRPLPDAFWTTVYDLGKKVESLHRLTQDDRWPQNAEKLAAKNRNELLRMNDLLQQVINSLPEEEATR